MNIRRKLILRHVAEILENQDVVAPPVKIESIVKAHGVTIVHVDESDENSGFLYREPKTGKVVLGVNSNHAPVRQRFTLAHELGHLLLHSSQPVHVDGKGMGFQVHLRNELSGEGTKRSEVEANLFAAELLMPRDMLRLELAGVQTLMTLDDEGLIAELAEKYEVSQMALSIRLSQLRWFFQ